MYTAVNRFNNFFLLLILMVLAAGSCKKKPPVAIPVPPAVTSISPSSGSAGTVVTITGTNFSVTPASNTVKFNGTAATVVTASATVLSVTAPVGGSTGPVTVSTADGTANGPAFTYIVPPPAPTITSVNPVSGAAGITVTITGTNFSTTASNNTVNFNGTAAVVTAATATTLVTTAPAGGTTGAVSVTTAGGTAGGPVFTYVAMPVITSLSPVSGAAGTAVTISGNNFSTTASNNTVNFNGTAATVTSATATTLMVTAPAGGTTGNVTVTTAGGTSNGILYTYTSLPVHDVYVLGKTAAGNCYWKNGVKTDLPADAQGNANIASIFVTATDVYYCGNNSSGTGTYWKNGVAAVMQNATSSSIHSIAVSGTDAYVCGEVINSGLPYPSYWKNGTYNAVTYSPYPVNTGVNMGNGRAFALALSGTDVYVAGHQSIQENNFYAGYWKNGAPVLLRNTSSSSANAVYINGAGLYFALNDINGVSSYSMNGSYVNLSPQPNNGGLKTGRLIYVTTSGDVYVTGQSNGASKYWKNGTMSGVITAQEFDGSIATCVHGVGNDVYIGGEYDGVNAIWGYWVNGSFVAIPGCTSVFDIYTR